MSTYVSIWDIISIALVIMAIACCLLIWFAGIVVDLYNKLFSKSSIVELFNLNNPVPIKATYKRDYITSQHIDNRINKWIVK